MANIVNLTKVGSNTPIARLVQGDKNSEKITFVLPEIDAPFDLNWRVIINGAEGLKDTAPLEIIRTEKEVQLLWTCGWSAAAEVGMTTLQIEGYDKKGECRWRSGEYCIDVGSAKEDGEAEVPEGGMTQIQELIQMAVTDATEAAEEARTAAMKAEQIADTKGWMYVDGRDDGHLYLITSDNQTEITMKDNEGRLIIVYGEGD